MIKFIPWYTVHGMQFNIQKYDMNLMNSLLYLILFIIHCAMSAQK